MPVYKAPVEDVMFLLSDVFPIERHNNLPGFADATPDTVEAILTEGAKLCEEVFAPLNRTGDVEGCTRNPDGSVTTPKGFKEAYEAYAAGGWMGLAAPEEYGGQGLPSLLNTIMQEFVSSSNLALGMYPGLTQGAIAALVVHGTEEQKKTYLPKMIEGAWTGPMNLTEPHCGTDLGLLKTKAVPNGDGSYAISGTKIFISAGEHDLAENIVHLVLARIEGAPAGVKGISLFIVPKVLVNPDGSLGERNDVVLAGLNHKMGYRGTTNTLLNFGEGVHTPGGRPGAVGFLVGEQHRGLAYMFTMMNEARIGVGSGAMSLGYTGYLQSLEYARTRPQGRPIASKDPTQPQVPIVEHADVKRMLLAQKSYVEGALALLLYCQRLVDEEKTAESDADRERATLLLDVLTPIAKSWPSQWCVEANSLAIQIHGGYGYTREYDVEQLYRDNRLNPIHEGTHGIQALDLLGRKVVMQGGAGLQLLVETLTATVERAVARGGELADLAEQLRA